MSKKRIILKKIRINLLVIVTITLYMSLCMMYVNNLLRENSDEMGGYVISDYANSEESSIKIYKTILSLCTQFIYERQEQGASVAEIKEGLYPYLNGISSLVDKGDIEVYGIVEGQIISNNPELEDFPGYDYKNTVWYKEGMEADGEIIFTDVYNDVRTGRKNVTIAKRVDKSDSILAIDVYIDEITDQLDFGELPAGVTYYLCDRNGKIIYFKAENYKEDKDYQGFVDSFYQQIKDNTLPDIVRDIDGSRKNIYYHRLENGWIAVLTTSYSNIFHGISNLYIVIFSVFSLGVLSVTIMAFRDYKNDKKREKLENEKKKVEYAAHIYEKATNSLAVSYREIYYLDLLTGTYRMVYPELNSENEIGDYKEAVDKHLFSGRIKNENAEEVLSFLSIENIVKELLHKDSIEIKYKRQSVGNESEYEWCLNTITIADRDNENKPVSATLAIRSIEIMIKEEKDRQELLKMAAKRAEIANKAKSDFLSRMSHDIRTPINVILGMTAVATMNIDNKEKVKDSLKKISMSGKHLLALINDVLDMSKIENGQEQLCEDKFEIIEVLESIISLFQNQLQEKNMTADFTVKRLINNSVIGDERRLQQIFVNIIGNAVKFSNTSGNIRISVEEKDSSISSKGYYQFVFEDNGIGMDSKFIERIFEPFARADESGATEGTGLGMAIAINIAKLMGGDIEVESTLGKGSRFKVDVYLKINKEQPEEIKEKDDEIANYTKNNYSGKRVLLVEDNESNIEIGRELLGVVGIQVEVAENGEKAIEKIIESEENYFDIIFMDIQMPVMNGYEATRIIRKMQRNDMKNIPIIAMSAYAFSDDLKKAKEAGMTGSISKPVEVSKLNKLLYTLLRQM